MNDHTKMLAKVRKGSKLELWAPNGLVEGVIETNPDHPPLIHYNDGRGTVEVYPGLERWPLVEVPISQLIPENPSNVVPFKRRR